MVVANGQYSEISHPLYGQLNFPPVVHELLETAPVRRLKGVKQLGFKYRHFPGAVHTRYTHSIGTAHWARKIGEQLGWSEKKIETAQIVAVLHDVGHGPYSHATEDVLESHNGGRDHDERTIDLIRSPEIADTLRKHGYSPMDVIGDTDVVDKVRQAWSGYSGVSKTKSHPTADEIDYLITDQHFTDVDFGMRPNRLLENLVEAGGELAVDIAALDAANSFAQLGPLYYKQIYSKDRLESAFYQRAVHMAIGSGKVSAEEFARLDDGEADSLLMSYPESGRMLEAINDVEHAPRTVHVYKAPGISRAEEEEAKGFDGAVTELSRNEFEYLKQHSIWHSDLQHIEEKLSRKYSLDYLVIDIPQSPFGRGCDPESIPVPEIKIRAGDGTLHSLYEYYPETASLVRKQTLRGWSGRVIVSPEDAEKLSREEKEKLGKEALDQCLFLIACR